MRHGWAIGLRCLSFIDMATARCLFYWLRSDIAVRLVNETLLIGEQDGGVVSLTSNIEGSP
jgi:hypothetical protein